MSHMKVKILYMEHMDMWISIVEPLSAYWFQVIPAVQEGVRVWFELITGRFHTRQDRWYPCPSQSWRAQKSICNV